MLRIAPGAIVFIRAMSILACAQALFRSSTAIYESSRAPLFIATRFTVAGPSKFAQSRVCSFQSGAYTSPLATTGPIRRAFLPVRLAPLCTISRQFTGIARPEPDLHCRNMQLRGGAEIPPHRAESSSSHRSPLPDTELETTPAAPPPPSTAAPGGAGGAAREPRRSFYAVAVGLAPGTYATWPECQKALGPGYTRCAGPVFPACFEQRERGGGGDARMGVRLGMRLERSRARAARRGRGSETLCGGE
jgi:hypothetical protein